MYFGVIFKCRILNVKTFYLWNIDDSAGSEHLVNGYSYPAEVILEFLYPMLNQRILILLFSLIIKIKLHFVHWNKEKYKNAQEAMDTNDHSGLFVLAIFLEV